MKLIYKKKIYNSLDIPLFLYFKDHLIKEKFNKELVQYKPGNVIPTKTIHTALAGKKVIKYKELPICFCIDTVEEKNTILRSMFHQNDSQNNALIFSPPDIPENILIEWIQNNLSKLK